MIKDDIRHPERLGNADSIVSGKYGQAAFGIRKVETMGGDSEIRLTVSKDAGEDFRDSSVKAMLITPEKAHALGKALIELSGLEKTAFTNPPEEPLHISLEEFRELREGDQVILRDDSTSDEVFKFGHSGKFRDEINGKIPVTITQVDSTDDSIRAVSSIGFGWFTHKAIKEVASKAPRHISKEEFDSIEAGDKLIIRKDLAVGEHYGGVYFNDSMRQWAVDGVQLNVMPTRSPSGNILAENITEDDWYIYSKEMIQEVIKAPKEHFRVRLSTKIWYAGKGGQITLDKGYAAIMNKPHAENVVKKYGGQLIKVDYSELEDK
ncbi:hypothetical protein EC99P1_00043 [Enterococcus phage EC99P1]|nr:hypothetical protein EC99P1_00043 [Enterococcus phage EC99P1]